MKVLTQIVTVFIAINLLSPNPALAQSPTEDALAQKEQELAKIQANLLVRAEQLSQRTAADTALQAQMVAHDLDNARVSLALAQAKHGTDGVLVVLTNPMKAEDVAATTEDLNIMSRIFEKKLQPAYATYESRLRSANIDRLFSNLRHRDSSQGTQAIYLHGFAALFLTHVGFPLCAAPKVEAEKIEKDVDPLWEDTKREISTSATTHKEDYAYVQYDPRNEYDAEKVEDLKTDLTKALRHAANIRNLKPDESIILAVASTQQATALEVAVEDGKKRYRVISSKAEPTSLLAPVLLTIRAKKADIDAYAKDQLNLEQFRQRVQFLTSHINLGPERANGISLRGRY